MDNWIIYKKPKYYPLVLKAIFDITCFREIRDILERDYELNPYELNPYEYKQYLINLEKYME